MAQIVDFSLLTTKQAAQLISVHESSVKRWCKEGSLACDVTEGGHRRISLPNLLGFAREKNLTCSLASFPAHVEDVWNGLKKAQSRNNFEKLFQLGYSLLRDDKGTQYKKLIRFCLEQGIPFNQVFDDIISRTLRQTGKDWRDNHLSIGTEHQITEIIRDLLHEIRLIPEIYLEEAENTASHRRRAIVGCNAGNLHDLGAQAIRIMLQQKGWQVIFVGGNMPADDFAKLQTRHKAELVCISFVSASMMSEAERVIEMLARFYDANCPYHLAVGGYSFPVDATKQLARPPFLDINTYRSTTAFSRWLDHQMNAETGLH